MMRRTRIKICGVTRVQDAVAAAQAGVDAIGLVFHPQARRGVTWDQAKDICDALPPFVTPVALFVDAPLDVLRQTLRGLPIRHVQLHGHELPDDAAALSEFRLVKAIRTERATFREQLLAWRQAMRDRQLGHLNGIVLETATPAGTGGTGVVNDWALVAEVMKEGGFDGLPPIIAAGGLTPGTVSKVVRIIRPYAVDVSSGVEERLCEKSVQKIHDFVRQVRAVDG